jgi:hypothetical protein
MSDADFDVHVGDMREVLASFEPNSIDSVVTDPPYGLSFMGKGWDRGVPGVEFWQEALRVAKPGAHLLAFGGTRTYHRLMCAIEDAGWEIRDCIMWVYGSGFPKSHNVGKAIDREAGAEREVVGNNPNHRAISGTLYEGVYQGGNTGAATITAPATDAAKQWEGWGTALKPAWEPIIVARKPLEGTVAQNVLEHGTGGINIDGCRVGVPMVGRTGEHNCGQPRANLYGKASTAYRHGDVVPGLGRWPANLIHDGSDEVVACFPRRVRAAHPLSSDKLGYRQRLTQAAMPGTQQETGQCTITAAPQPASFTAQKRARKTGVRATLIRL